MPFPIFSRFPPTKWLLFLSLILARLQGTCKHQSPLEACRVTTAAGNCAPVPFANQVKGAQFITQPFLRGNLTPHRAAHFLEDSVGLTVLDLL